MAFGNFDLDRITLSQRHTLAEGKTKIIHGLEDHSGYVIMENKDDITAGDGAKHDVIEGKANASTTITSNIFQYLEQEGIPTHFEEQLSDTEILTQNCDMVALECIFRFVSTGSYHKRDTYINGENALPDGTILETPIMEFFYKNDVYVEGQEKPISDPLMECNTQGLPKFENGSFVLLHPATGERLDYYKVVNPSTHQELSEKDIFGEQKQILQHAITIEKQTIQVGQALKKIFQQAEIDVFDGKIEFGINKQGKLVVADVIDGDSCRLRIPSVLEGEDGQTYLGKGINHKDVLESLEQKYFEPINNFLEFIANIEIKDNNSKNIGKTRIKLQEQARKKAEEMLSKYDLSQYFTGKVHTLFKRQEKGKPDNKILFTRGGTEGVRYLFQQEVSTWKAYSENNGKVRVLEAEGLDKQGYREGEDTKETGDKYQKLARIIEKLWNRESMKEVIDSTIKQVEYIQDQI